MKEPQRVRRLRRLRHEAGLSIERLARLADMSAKTIWNIETGRTQPLSSTAAVLRDALAAALGRPVTVDEILQEEAANGHENA